MNLIQYNCNIIKRYLSVYKIWTFVEVFVISYFIVWSAALGIIIGSLMPWQDPTRLGPFLIESYVYTLLVFVLPTVFFLASFSFSLATFTRNILYTYIGILTLFTCYGIGFFLTKDMETETIAVLLDPLGFGAFFHATKYWTVAEKNLMLIPLKGLFLQNRVLWSFISVILLGITYKKFSFTEKMTRSKAKSKVDTEQIRIIPKENVGWKIPSINLEFTTKLSFQQFLNQIKVEFFGIIKSIPFIIILIFAFLNVFGSLPTNMGSIGYGTPRHPLTFLMIDGIQGGYTFFLFIIVTFYTGEMIWKDRSVKINDIMDSLPVSNWIPYASKFVALTLVIAFFVFIGLLTGIGYQIANGYYNIELMQYLKSLFLFQFFEFILLAILGFFIQTVVNNKFLGYLFMVIYFLMLEILPGLGLIDNLYYFAQDLYIRYSDMNHFGPIVKSATWFAIYRIFFAIILCVFCILFWVRGTEIKMKLRFKLTKLRFNKSLITVFGLVLIFFFSTGSYINYNTHYLNVYETKNEIEMKKVNYEKKFKKYKDVIQPKITDIIADVDIFPDERNVNIKGTYFLKNKSSVPIDSIHITINDKLKVNSFHFTNGKQVFVDKCGYYTYELENPLQPTELVSFDFDIAFLTRGFVNHDPNTKIVRNGTFITNYDYFPHIGYLASRELEDKHKRKKYNLPPPERMPSLENLKARRLNYINQEADWINFETIVSTSEDQIAIASGYLQKEWTENGRKYFHYKMDIPIINFFCYMSGKYNVKKDKWNDVNIEVYYHDTHEYNLDKMINSAKKGLEYFSKNFSPYQHKQYRVIEFPRYSSFAQSFANTIPYSESAGFIANLEDENDIDMVFYSTAHELAHQWWGHQVVSANVQGATLMSEALAQYSALMIMEKEYGLENMRRFLKYELDKYLDGRGGEQLKELPLYLNENQGYIHYQKGSLAMYALRDYIGEEVLNVALAKYVQDVGYQEPPYTNSLEFLSYIKQATPDSLQNAIEDMFETITLYENKAKEATFTKTEDGKYQVNITIETKKFRADSLGNETEIPINDWIYIAVFGEEKVNGKNKEKQLYLIKHKLDQPIQKFQIIVDELPVKAGIDPYSLLIDRIWDNNLVKVEEGL